MSYWLGLYFARSVQYSCMHHLGKIDFFWKNKMAGYSAHFNEIFILKKSINLWNSAWMVTFDNKSRYHIHKPFFLNKRPICDVIARIHFFPWEFRYLLLLVYSLNSFSLYSIWTNLYMTLTLHIIVHLGCARHWHTCINMDLRTSRYKAQAWMSRPTKAKMRVSTQSFFNSHTAWIECVHNAEVIVMLTMFTWKKGIKKLHSTFHEWKCHMLIESHMMHVVYYETRLNLCMS